MNERTKNFAAWWLQLAEPTQMRVGQWRIGDRLEDKDVASLEAAGVTMSEPVLSLEDWSLIGLGQWWTHILKPEERPRVIAALHDADGAQPYLQHLSLHRQPGRMASFQGVDEPIAPTRYPFSTEQVAFLEEAGKSL